MTYTLALMPSVPAFQRPQRFLFTVEGERIADVEYRPDPGDGAPFTQVERMSFDSIASITTRVCPSCSVAHLLALCAAVETLTGTAAPPRAERLRLVAAELERAASHLATLSTVFRILKLPRPAQTCADHAAAVRDLLRDLTGGALSIWLRPGGMGVKEAPDGERMLQGLETIRARLYPFAERMLAWRMLLARTVDVGVISRGAAEQFGLAGPLARAAGLSVDQRLDAPYGAYADLPPKMVVQEGGDVYARIAVLLLEALEALRLAEQALREPLEGPLRTLLPETLPASAASAVVEAPRGPLHYEVESDGRRITRISVRSAPQLDRLLARTALVNAAIDDAALIVASTDPCDGCLAASTVL